MSYVAHKQFLIIVADKEFQEHSKLSQYYSDRFSLLIRVEKDNTHNLIKDKSIQLRVVSI